MPTRPGFLQPKPKIDEAEWAETQARTVRRLHAFFSPELAAAEAEAEAAAAAHAASDAQAAPDAQAATGDQASGPSVGVAPATGTAERLEAESSVAVADEPREPDSTTDSRPGLVVSGISDQAEAAPRPIVVYDGTAEVASVPLPAPADARAPIDADISAAIPGDVADADSEAPLVGVMAMPTDDMGWDLERPLVGVFEAPDDAAVEAFTETPVASPDDRPAEPDVTVEPSVVTKPRAPKAPKARAAGTKARPAGSVPVKSAAKSKVAAKPAAAKAAAKPGAARPAVAAKPSRPVAAKPSRPVAAKPGASPFGAAAPASASVAHCPYCATVLDPAPTSNRRCERCRHRIMVKKVNGAAVYLTEAALQVFDAERKRVSNLARWTKERDRWLRLAAAVGAPEERRAQLAKARLTDDVVATSRKLYVNNADRAFRAARAKQDWVAAGRLRREKAVALHAGAGSPMPPGSEVVAIFREGVAAELRGISEIARDAQLVSGKCCAACTADEGTVVRIARELKAPRLPHAECPRGLCRCHWDLAEKDRLTVRRYLRRRSGSE